MTPAVLMAFVCGSKQLKSVGRLIVIPTVFSTGEPVLFGVSIVLNLLPYLLMTPSAIANQVPTYTAIVTGLVGCLIGVVLPWTTPSVLHSLSANPAPVRAAVPSVVIILVDIIIWLPFVKAYDRNIVLKKMETEE